nr:hypothetical protein [Desulfovibrio sp.]
MTKIMKRDWLTYDDILAFEPRLREELANFFAFEDCSVFFSSQGEDSPATLDKNSGEALLPLEFNGRRRATLYIKGFNPGNAPSDAGFLARLASLCLARLYYEKATRIDENTGLLTEDALFDILRERIGERKEILNNARQIIPARAGICVGFIVVSWPEASRIAEEFDYDFKNYMFAGLARELRRFLPPDASGAVIGKNEGLYEFGVLFPASGRGKCHIVARDILAGLESLVFRDKLSRVGRRPRLAAGHAIYPQDMPGEELTLPIAEQAARLRDRARFASGTAQSSPGGIEAFARILRRGGRIAETLPDGKFKINLGRAAGARVGMRFAIREIAGNAYLGELVLMDVGIKRAIAEIISLENPAAPPAIGDKLVF